MILFRRSVSIEMFSLHKGTRKVYADSMIKVRLTRINYLGYFRVLVMLIPKLTP